MEDGRRGRRHQNSCTGFFGQFWGFAQFTVSDTGNYVTSRRDFQRIANDCRVDLRLIWVWPRIIVDRQSGTVISSRWQFPIHAT